MDSQNPYASPSAGPQLALPVAGGSGFGRSGDLLVVKRDTALPDRCVKCNAPADGYRRRVKLAWHPPLAYLILLLLGPLPYILVAIVYTKKLNVHVGLCPDHVRKRRWNLLVAILALPLGIALLIPAVAVDDTGFLILVILGAAIGALIYGVVACRVVWPKKIADNVAWVKGVCPEYLAELPEHGGLIVPKRRPDAA